MVDESPITKRCSKCEQTKTLDRFALSKKQKDGRNGWCRECMSAYAKARQQAKTPEQHARDAEACREYRGRRSEDDHEREKAKTRAREAAHRERNAELGGPPANDAPKRCCRCKHHLPRTDFFVSLGRPDGLATVCKRCSLAIKRGYRAANPERAREKDAARREREGDKRREVVRRSAAKHKAKYAAQRQARYRRDREQLRNKARLYYATKPAYRKWSLENAKRRSLEKPAETAAAKRRWIERNPDKVRDNAIKQSHTRRARMNAAETRFSLKVWAQVLAYYGHACAYCLKPQSALSRRLTVDHIHPISRMGGNDFDNLAPACLRCNQKKSRRTPLEFIADIPPLIPNPERQ